MTPPEPKDNPSPLTEAPSFAEVLVSRLRQSCTPKVVSWPSQAQVPSNSVESELDDDPLPEMEPASAAPPATLPTRRLLTCLRLAATFVSEEALEPLRLRGAVTILRGIDVRDLPLIMEGLKTALPDQGWRAGASARTVPTTEELWMALNQGKIRQAMMDAPKAARRARAFHWPLEFPDVMQRGGFDVVLGNPPWERIKLQEQEFFAALSLEIANAPNKAARDKLIKSLEKAAPGTPDRALFDAFIMAKREAEATSEFVRLPGEDGGRFALTGRGDVNTYALFAELFANLARQRAGVIVPTGIATDATTAPFFAHLVEKQRLARLVDFDNRLPLFTSVHRMFKFALLTLGRDEPAAQFAFFLTTPAQLAEPERNFSLSPADIAAINPNTKTAPVFRSRADAELTAKIHKSSPVLVEEGKGQAGNSWAADFHSRIWHMSEDSEWFKTDAVLAASEHTLCGPDWVKLTAAGEERFVPLYEAKMIHHFDYRWSTYAANATGTFDLSPAEKCSPSAEVRARYWLPQAEVKRRLLRNNWNHDWLLGWRDITNATNERTVIASVFPRSGSGDTILLFFPRVTRVEKVTGLIGNLSSCALDYVARQKVGGTHLKFNVFFQLPILPPDFYTELRLAFITPKVLELTYTSHSLAPSPAILAMTARPSPGTRTAAPSCAPISTPSTPAPTA